MIMGNEFNALLFNEAVSISRKATLHMCIDVQGSVVALHLP